MTTSKSKRGAFGTSDLTGDTHPVVPAALRRPRVPRSDPESLTTFSTKLPRETLAEVKATAALRGVRIQDIVDEALQAWLRDNAR